MILRSFTEPFNTKSHAKEIEIKINGVSTAKYTEKGNVPLSGSICLQAHSGGPYEVWYRNIRLKQPEID